jgi:Domain of unknown function (DUF4082)
MRRQFLLAAIATLALAGCAEAPTAAVPAENPTSPPSGPSFFASGDRWGIFDGLTPASTLDASPGWEVGTRFYVTRPGCVVKLRFYRAAGETGSNTVKLWSNSGQLLGYQTFYATTAGWHDVELRNHGIGPYVDLSICIQTNTWYRVSVNTNSKQVKTFGYLDNGPIVNGPVVADAGYYGQPTGSMPTTQTGSIFFVDVVFEED